MIMELRKVCWKSAKVGIKTTNRSSRCENVYGSFTFSNTSLDPTCYAGRSTQSHKISLTSSRAVPHLLKNGEQFKAGDPDPLPSLTIGETIMRRTHRAFGYTQTGTINHSSHHILIFANTGAQICSS